MDFGTPNTTKYCTITNEIKIFKTLYPHDLQVYDVPPTGEITLTEFQEVGLERLKLLRLVESLSLRSDLKTLEARKESLRDSLRKDGLKYYANLISGTGCKSNTEMEYQARRKDNISHFILRLAYCKVPDQMKWFMNQEIELFKIRFSALDKEGVDKFLSIHELNCQQISQDEKEKLRENLQTSTFKVTNIDATEFYKVPFYNVIDLVRTRKVYLENGIAYVPRTEMISFCVSFYKEKLHTAMQEAKGWLENVSDDERVTNYLNVLPGSFSGMTKVVWSTTSTPLDKIEELSKTSYPMCMRTLHEALRTHHHLKHSGRLQYGLFLKGIGVSLEDSLQFWREAFSQKTDLEKFEKQYAYNIRYLYGKEGKQTNYTPLGCNKIITNTVGPGEYHGCPFRHMDQTSLRQKLQSYGFPDPDAKEIVELAKGGQYLLACTRYFQTIHKQLPDQPFVHPNAYFAESRKILTKDDDAMDVESAENSSQSGRSKVERFTNTPSRRNDILNTPTNNERSFSTPSRKIENVSTTPSRVVSKSKPKNMEKLLNDDEIAELMADDF